MSGRLILGIAVVLVATALVANNLRRRERRTEYWGESLLSGLSTLVIGLFLIALEIGPTGQA